LRVAALRTPSVWIALAIVCAAILASVIAPYGPTEITTAQLQAPSKDHLFGTDALGMDVFSRVLYAARKDLWLAFAAATLAC
jgi:peptide/nickel transport system permease protein